MIATRLILGLGAGLAGALLAVAPLGGGLLAGWLFSLSPLPFSLAALIWGQLAVRVAMLVAFAVLAIGMQPLLAAGFVGGVALPAALAARAALLHRPGPDGVEWYPGGRIVAWLALGCAALVALLLVAMGEGDLDAYRAIAGKAAEAFVAQMPADAPLPPETRAALPALIANLVLPAALPATLLLMQLGALWLGVRVAASAGALARPPFRLAELLYPAWLMAALGAALVATALPGWAGIFGVVAAGALGFAYLVYGLATVHALAANRPARVAILIAVYGALLLSPWAAPLLVTLGIVEHMLSLRRRFAIPSPHQP